MSQGYLQRIESDAKPGSDFKSSVRVRVCGEKGYLNIKSASLGIRRREFEYIIPVEDASEMLQTLCVGPLIEKKRHFVTVGQHLWEIDEFEGENAGLIVAEIELSTEDEVFELPSWLGSEVSDDPRYYNVCLSTHPYSEW